MSQERKEKKKPIPPLPPFLSVYFPHTVTYPALWLVWKLLDPDEVERQQPFKFLEKMTVTLYSLETQDSGALAAGAPP